MLAHYGPFGHTENKGLTAMRRVDVQQSSSFLADLVEPISLSNRRRLAHRHASGYRATGRSSGAMAKGTIP